MEHHKIPLRDTNNFSPFFIDYIEQKQTLKPFYNRFPTIENFKSQIKEKSDYFKKETRELLVATLRRQYQNIELKSAAESNLEALLDKNTFTITTGHQLNIFTGPLYFIYKIVTVINACRDLKKKYPEYNFVPVYWMASEDHDFEEISYFKLDGKKFVWSTNQTGAVGRFNPKEIKALFDQIPGDIELFRQAYLKSETLSDAVRFYVDHLFGDEGLIVIDADDRNLKKLLIPVIEDDLFSHSSKKKVDETNTALEKVGYSTQVHAREINFFYLDKDIRGRLERSGTTFAVVDSNLSFSDEAIKSLIKNEPEKFSPNVILRPLYQEIILPNLGYAGGPAEVVYWLQLKSVFEHFKVPFPILMPRNFALVVSGPLSRKWQKTGLSINDLFHDKNFLFNDWTLKHTHHNLTLSAEMKLVKDAAENIKKRASEIDVTLEPLIGAEATKTLHALEKIEKKMLKAEKRLHSDKLRQIDEVKEALFPNRGLQERSENFLGFYQQDSNFIQILLTHLSPFDFQFNVLIYPHK